MKKGNTANLKQNFVLQVKASHILQIYTKKPINDMTCDKDCLLLP